MAQTYTTNETHARLLVPSLENGAVAGLLTFLFIAVVVFLSFHSDGAPGAVSADAPPTEFSSGRAMKQLAVISKSPHQLGTPEHEEVRNYILKELEAMGLSPEMQQTTAINRQWYWTLRAGTVENVIVRLPGTANTKAVMFAGHYDSMPYAYGASDDGAAVVSMLETLRALKAGPPLKNDLIFLFTDGEEAGLLGANAFVDEHPLAKQVGVVFNFEARGNHGPSIMFETSDGNGWLIKEFARTARYPVSHSLAYEIYKRLPNDTDLTAFRQAGLAGLNFAYVDGLPSYHTALDSFQRIDERSLQHHGSYMLGLARHFGDLDLTQERREVNAVYFDLLGSLLVHYSGFWVLPLTALLTLLFAGLLVVGVRRGRLTLSGIVWGFLVFLLALILAVGIVWLVWTLILKLHYGSRPMPQGQTYESNLYLLSFIALTIALTSALYTRFRQKVGVENLTAGALLWWLILLILSSLFVPGASYLFTWPLLFSLGSLWVCLARPARPFGSKALIGLLLITALPGLILMTPVIYQTFVGLTLNSIGVVAAMIVLLLGLLVPHLNLMARPRKWLLPALMGLASIGLILAGALTSSFDAKHPEPNSIFYGLDADTGKAVWASVDQKTDEWTGQFLTPHPQSNRLNQFFPPAVTDNFLQAEAPAAALAAPTLDLLDDSTRNGVRTLRMHLSSPRQAPVMQIFIDSQTELVRASLNGKQMEEGNTPAVARSKNGWNMRYFAVPPQGIEFVAELASSAPVKLRVVDVSYGLPVIPNRTFAARPDDMIPSSAPFTDTTLVSKSFVF
jgi:hypothetical protein